mgnify:CR=1 FL=1
MVAAGLRRKSRVYSKVGCQRNPCVFSQYTLKGSKNFCPSRSLLIVVIFLFLIIEKHPDNYKGLDLDKDKNNDNDNDNDNEKDLSGLFTQTSNFYIKNSTCWDIVCYKNIPSVCFDYCLAKGKAKACLRDIFVF